MKLPIKIMRGGFLAAVAAFTLAGAAVAEYPERPVTLIVPWGAGWYRCYRPDYWQFIAGRVGSTS